MSLFPDITPLTKEVEKFNNKQDQVIALLEEHNKLLKQILDKK